MYKLEREAAGDAESERNTKLTESYLDIKTNNLAYTGIKDKIYFHYTMVKLKKLILGIQIDRR